MLRFRKGTIKSKIYIGGEEQSKKLITFTYVGKETRRITKIFKNTSIIIAFKTNNAIERNLHIRAQNTGKLGRYNSSDVYQLKCPDGNKSMLVKPGENHPEVQ
jgi:pyruvate kinase